MPAAADDKAQAVTTTQRAALTRLIASLDALGWGYDLLLDAEGALAIRPHDDTDLADDEYDHVAYVSVLGDFTDAIVHELDHIDAYVVDEEGEQRRVAGHTAEDVLAAGLSGRRGTDPSTHPAPAGPVDNHILADVQRLLTALDATGKPYALAVSGGGLILDAGERSVPGRSVDPTAFTLLSIARASIDHLQARRGLDGGVFMRLGRHGGRYDAAEVASLLERPAPVPMQLEDKGIDWDHLLDGEEGDDDAAERTWG
ncbi:uncharacterized protein LOC62_05G007580 [Vanrija pseudolonga]|uniref:Uncharacterized protein n=1 Tax=Vanrija pseudolonga TaxID=143232 RepID=A0AAF1BKJ9_9TREE|nr:hypothetical protein LOC62_05G007580 [Vanrija pseudolonga]